MAAIEFLVRLAVNKEIDAVLVLLLAEERIPNLSSPKLSQLGIERLKTVPHDMTHRHAANVAHPVIRPCQAEVGVSQDIARESVSCLLQHWLEDAGKFVRTAHRVERILRTTQRRDCPFECIWVLRGP